ncbi:putative peptidoglycan glycosyltransferase FtsW [Spirochaetota bacterium]|nr:putative peptidoglycan glycosyltransferase FtsW [Spirochaetota bacterium]
MNSPHRPFTYSATHSNTHSGQNKTDNENPKPKSIFKRLFTTIDLQLFLIVLTLSIIGIIFSYSSQIQIFETRINPYNKYIKQIFYLISGLVVMWLGSLISYKRLAEHSHLLYLLSVLLLIYTLIAGTAVNQSRRWISLGVLSIQPSEFVKIAMIIFIANYLDKIKNQLGNLKQLFILALMIAFPLFLIILQPDLGTAVVFLPVILMMIIMVDIKRRYLLAFAFLLVLTSTLCLLLIYSQLETAPLVLALLFKDSPVYLIWIGVFFLVISLFFFSINIRMQNLILERIAFYSFVLASAVALTLFTYYVLLRGYQKERLLVFLNPQDYKWDLGYNAIQSRVTIGSGGWFGKGLFNGTQSQLGFLPSKSTDFVFAVISEELGFIGASLILILFLLFLLRLVKMALSVKDYLGGLILIGILTLFFIQIFINIGMTIGLMPVTGLPLPFLSAGGSTLWSSLLAIGIAFNVYARRHVNN